MVRVYVDKTTGSTYYIDSQGTARYGPPPGLYKSGGFTEITELAHLRAALKETNQSN